MRLAIVLLMTTAAFGQLWSGIIDPLRAIDWTTAGVEDGIPTRNNVCTTLSAGATVTQINNALNACGAGNVVALNAGTYNLSGTISPPSNVTLRGAGADQTHLVFSSMSGCQAGNCAIQIQGRFFDTGTPYNVVPFGVDPANLKNFTGTNGQANVYTRGATVVNISATTGTNNLQVGDTLVLVQSDPTQPAQPAPTAQGNPSCANVDTNASTPNNGCSREGTRTNSGGVSQGIQHWARVTAINGTAITITPGLYQDTWSSSLSPKAYWWGGSKTGVGIENLSIETNALTGFSVISFWQATNSWIKGVAIHQTGNRDTIGVMVSTHITLQDNWYSGSCTGGCGGGATGYVTEFWGSPNCLEQNTIHDNGQAAWVFSAINPGTVVAYNYEHQTAFDNSKTYYTLHEDGNWYNLFEGNDTKLYRPDDFHGTQYFGTAFRNRIGNAQQASVDIWAYNRYFNIIGNVLGETGVTLYQCLAPDSSANCARAGTKIYRFGFAGANQGPSVECGSPGCLYQDTTAPGGMMRWGNYDTVNAASRFVSAEVPSGISLYPNPVPADQNLPSSFYLNSKPNWWPATKPWPAVGPDVTGGNISGVGGHAYTTPAQDCYTSASGNMANFNAATCYAVAGSTTGVQGTITVKGNISFQ